jgi:histidinol-phosphatase (PHP family)
MWTNYHTHSSFCDGKSEMSDIITKAKELKIKSLGFSSHAPLPFECKWCMKREALQRYVDEIGMLSSIHNDIELYKGLEIDYIPDTVNVSHFNETLDYTIGSIHFVEKFSDGKGWEIDGPHQFFLEGFKQIFHNNIKDVIVRYFDLTCEMVNNFPPTIVGHLDKIKIQNIDNKFFSENERWYREEVKKTIAVIAKSQCIVEVNTRGIYQKKSESVYPSPWILELIFENHIPITINSDAHHADDLRGYFPETARLLHQIGFRKLSLLRDGQWQQAHFNEDGIT